MLYSITQKYTLTSHLLLSLLVLDYAFSIFCCILHTGLQVKATFRQCFSTWVKKQTISLSFQLGSALNAARIGTTGHYSKMMQPPQVEK